MSDLSFYHRLMNRGMNEIENENSINRENNKINRQRRIQSYKQIQEQRQQSREYKLRQQQEKELKRYNFVKAKLEPLKLNDMQLQGLKDKLHQHEMMGNSDITDEIKVSILDKQQEINNQVQDLKDFIKNNPKVEKYFDLYFDPNNYIGGKRKSKRKSKCKSKRKSKCKSKRKSKCKSRSKRKSRY